MGKMIDDYFEKVMDLEDERYDAEISVQLVPLEKANLNDHVRFGKNVWKVIGVENEKKLLLSKDCMGMDFDYLFGQEDNDSSFDVEETLKDILNSSKTVDYAKEAEEVRKYFREWFCDKYFSKEELDRIVLHGIKTVVPGDTITQTFNEYVFLLSEEEVRQYIPKKEERIATMHVMFNDVKRAWLLRVDGKEEYQVVVNSNGEFEKVPVGRMCEWFRPAVWVE